MEFEQKYQIISNATKRDILDSILSNVFRNLKLNQKTTLRLLEDIICLDIISSPNFSPLETWKKRNRFKIPVIM